MDEEETKGFCRGCLKYCDEFMELLQYTEKNRRMFVYATGLQVKRNDAFKFQICKDCYLNMRIASKFKKQCRISDRRFKNFLALKGDGDNRDFKTFLRDNPVVLRLPTNSTPAHNKTRDEDDSIRNFITDMLQNEEIPDTESAIIRQVLEEETDVLEDSLDSHWLQDDISIASDLSLPNSFKPFTADSVKSARSANKKENIERNESYLAFKEFLVPKSKGPELMKTQDTSEKLQQFSATADIIDNELSNSFNTFAQKHVVLKQDKNIFTFNDLAFDPTSDKNGSKSAVIKEVFVKTNTDSDKGSQCTIDRNLEKALQDEGTHEFSLENLLGSSKDHPNLPEPSTPLINNIIFGGNVDNGNDSIGYSISNAGKFIEKYKVVEGDTALDDYFRRYSSDKDCNIQKKIEIIENKIINGDISNENRCERSNEPDVKVPLKPKDLELNADDTLNCDFFEEIQNEALKAKKSNKQKVDCVVYDDSKFCIENFHCKICNIKYKDLKALKIHFCRMHKIQIRTNRKVSIRKYRVCPKCGIEVLSSQMNMHLKTHEDRRAQCDICKLWFTTKNKLIFHMSRHYLTASERQKIADKKKKFLCTICGAKIGTYRNYQTHQQRHTKEYTKWCNICGMGFITNYDLNEHSVKHSREKAFSCEFCQKRYSRKRCLNRHLASHTDANLFKCKFCSVTLMNWASVKRHMTSKTCLKLRRELGFENEDYFEAMRSYNQK